MSKERIATEMNPLPRSDYNLNSPYNIIPLITHQGYEKKRNDHQLKKLLIVKQILLVSTIRNIWGPVWRICILMLGCKGLLYK